MKGIGRHYNLDHFGMSTTSRVVSCAVPSGHLRRVVAPLGYADLSARCGGNLIVCFLGMNDDWFPNGQEDHKSQL